MLAAVMLAAGALASSPELGKAEGRCRTGESGPAFLVAVDGLKDRQGLLKLEAYPANDRDFLADDNVLLNAGKTFRRAEMPIPAHGPVQMCIRVPAPGPYVLSLLHDRDANHRFDLSGDGIGFSANPKLGLGKPRVANATVVAGATPTRITIVLNYRRGLLNFAPLATE